MNRLLAKYPQIENFLNSGFNPDNYRVDVMAKVRMLNFVCLIGITNLFALGVIAIIQNNLTLGLSDIAVSFFLVWLVLFLRSNKNYYLVSSLGVAVVGLLFVYLFVSGGVEGTANLWYYTFPLFAYFLMDTKRGTIYTMALLAFAILAYFLKDEFSFINNYSKNFMIRFVPSFLVVVLYAFIFERTKEKTFKKIESSNNELNSTIKKLEANEKELKILYEELERRVNERTAELAKSNTQLLKEIEEKNIAKEEAELSNRLKTEFLAQMSHEIRTPVNTILSYSSLIKDGLNENCDVKFQSEFQAIENGSKRLIRTIDSLLNMSQLQSGSFEIIKEEIDLFEDILSNLIREFRPLAAQKNIEISINEESNAQIIIGDKYTITQIFANLIDNAIKYTDEGKIDISIYLKNNNSINVDITDTGIGISDGYFEIIFNPFRQEEQGYTRRYEGNGLGLALVKKYCELNDVEISVHSKKFKGTTFTVSFKIKAITKASTLV